jgi:hypothetical protein
MTPSRFSVATGVFLLAALALPTHADIIAD